MKLGVLGILAASGVASTPALAFVPSTWHAQAQAGHTRATRPSQCPCAMDQGCLRSPGRSSMMKKDIGDEGAWVLLQRGLRKVAPLAGLALGSFVRPWVAPMSSGPAWAVEEATVKTVEAPTTAAASANKMAAQPGDDLFEEVWKLTGKFYLDRSFGGHDWDQVHSELRAKARAEDQGSEVRTTKRMLKLLNDKYTTLLSPSTYTEMSRFDPIGAGFMLSLDDDGYFTVSSDPRPGTEAARQHVEKGDKVLEIEGVAVKGKSVFDALDLITKDDRPDVRLTIQSHKDASTRPLVLPREFQAVSNPVSYQLFEGSSSSNGKPVGYIRLREFNSLARPKVQDAITDLDKQGAEEYVLDLRGNPGGSVQSAVGVAGLFLDESKVVTYIQDATGKKLPLKTQGEPVLRTEPLVVWTDKRSASASEILASALHDNCRAALMGQNTFGKGLVQGVFGLSDGRGLVMTVASYETPKGSSIQGKGIAPDVPAAIPGSSPLGTLGPPDVSVVSPDTFLLFSGDTCPLPPTQP